MKGGSGVNAHWFRNFSTDDADGYDLKLTEADVDKQYEAFGFLWAWTKSKDFLSNLEDIEQKKKPTGQCLSDSNETIQVTPIPKAAWDKLNPVEEKPKDKTEEKVEDTKTEEKDWATQTTAHATALLAAVYALAF